jgi:DNA repair protein RecN (Recombination protein N)
MLTNLHISNFAIVRGLDIEWQPGMTSITGETGAGKSISLDALALCLGERADADAIRPGCDKADLVATFDVRKLASAQQWLAEHDLLMAMPGQDATTTAPQECIIRRVIGHEGRSRAYINGVQVPAQQLKALAPHLLSIHGQHAHQQLLKADVQRQNLDAFADNHSLLLACRNQWKLMQQKRQQIAEATLLQQQREAQRQLLEYQVEELDQFSPQADEFAELEQEHQRLSNSHQLIAGSQQCLTLLSEHEDANILQLLQQASLLLSEQSALDARLSPLEQMLQDALVQVEETSRELRRYAERIDVDPARLTEIDQRLSTWLNLSRKHQVHAHALAEHHQQLKTQLEQLHQGESLLQLWQEELAEAEQHYAASANALSIARQNAAGHFADAIAQRMHDLSMPNAKIQLNVQAQGMAKASAQGWDLVDMLVSTNPGQPLQPLHKVVSGGELSRISLSVQVILATKVTTPTLIFDEVDVGISGPVAAGVGKLLRQLGENTQVICVTHLPQVASQGHQQLFVEKYTDGIATETRMRALEPQERVAEIARLLAGENISASALANARELLSQS